MQTHRLLFFAIATLLLVPASVLLGQSCTGGSVPYSCIPDDYSDAEVIGVSEIITPYDNNGSQVFSYSDTELGASLQAYFDGDVRAYLYRTDPVYGRVQVNYGPDQNAAWSLPAPFVTGVTYTASTDHSVTLYFCDENPDGGAGGLQCFDGGFDFTAQQQPTSYGSGTTVFTPCDVDADPEDCDDEMYVSDPEFPLGSTQWTVDTTLPVITSISPTSLTIGPNGSSGTFQIYGNHLTALGDDLYPLPTTTGSGFTISLAEANFDNLLTVNYTLAANASLGAQHVWVTTYAGVDNDNGTTSNNEIDIWDPPTQIQAVSPQSAQSGTTTTFTITGSGFGNNPTVSVGPPGVTGGLNALPVWPYTTIYVSVTVPSSVTAGDVTITVTAGNIGNPFQPPPQQNQATQNVPISGAPPPAQAPTIVWGQGQPACQTPTQAPPATVVIGYWAADCVYRLHSGAARGNSGAK